MLIWHRKERGNGHAVWIQRCISLRDGIGTCPNIEVKIDITDKSPFFIGPYHVKEEDKDSHRYRNEAFMLFRNIIGRIFSLL